jgi:hypothetical protein
MEKWKILLIVVLSPFVIYIFCKVCAAGFYAGFRSMKSHFDRKESLNGEDTITERNNNQQE